MKNNYLQQLQTYKVDNADLLKGIDDLFIEFQFERLYQSAEQDSIEDIIDWYNTEVNKCTMRVERIPVLECVGWSFDEKSGSLVHNSGEFFRVDGIRVKNSNDREVVGGWEQPILTQIGFDGGILGLIRKRINDIPHYLVEAKAEPGNPNIVQISPTVQATFSNIKCAHGGARTPFVDYFLNPNKNDAKIIFERWMSEGGGRLYNKRNKSMIVEVFEIESPRPTRYRWVTLNQLVMLTRLTDAIIAPHIRGILAAV